MDNLLPYYERELAFLRDSLGQFAPRHPKIAARLSMSGGQTDDPNVERLLQSSALLGARISEKLDDDYPEFAEALLETIYPEYLRAFPSCTVAEFDIGNAFSQLTQAVEIARGTELESRVGACRFRTAYDVVLAPISITDVRFAKATTIPSTAPLPANVTGILSITFASLTDGDAFRSVVPPTLRVHVDSNPPSTAALTDALLMRTPVAFVDVERSGRWKALSRVPIGAVGFDDRDTLLDKLVGAPSAFRFMAEYFAFPAKFDFLDIDFGRLARAAGPCRQITLHLPVVDLPMESSAYRALEELVTGNLRLFCTPVVNLFGLDATPITIKDGPGAYPVTPQALKMPGIEVHSVESVRMTRETTPNREGKVPIPPYHGLKHGHSPFEPGFYWVAHREQPFGATPSHKTILTLVDIVGNTIRPDTNQLVVEVTCTNGNYPQTLPAGSADGDLLNENENLAGRISMLRSPSPSRHRIRDRGDLWNLISALSPHAILLQPAGLPALKKLLRQHVPEASRATPQIEAITNLDHKRVMQWMSIPPMPSFVRGIEIALTIDESAFNACSLHTFASVMDRFYAPYAPASGYIQLTVRGRDSDKELWRCPARLGTTQVV